MPALPTNVYPEQVRVRRRWATGVAESPFTLSQQVYQWPGARWEIEVTLQPMSKTLAQLWTQFFYDLAGRAGTFTMDLTPHCPGLAPAPAVKTFRLADPEVGWDSKLAVQFGFSFRAVEVV